MKEYIIKVLQEIGENPQREGLLETPSRFEKAYRFLTSGYQVNIEELVGNAIFEENIEELILVKDVEFYSLCEHHLLPFYGKISVGYIPNQKIIGLSKIPRIIDVFSRRLQIQERMTDQIGKALESILQPKGVAVFCKSQHFCMMMRGVQKQKADLLTFSFLGELKNNIERKNEFLNLIR